MSRLICIKLRWRPFKSCFCSSCLLTKQYDTDTRSASSHHPVVVYFPKAAPHTEGFIPYLKLCLCNDDDWNRSGSRRSESRVSALDLVQSVCVCSLAFTDLHPAFWQQVWPGGPNHASCVPSICHHVYARASANTRKFIVLLFLRCVFSYMLLLMAYFFFLLLLLNLTFRKSFITGFVSIVMAHLAKNSLKDLHSVHKQTRVDDFKSVHVGTQF